MPAPYHIEPVANEVGRYFCRSRSLFCSDPNPSGCRYSYQNKGESGPKHIAGDRCPKCASHDLKHIDYLVDLTLFNGLGKCACDRWTMYLQPLIRKLSAAEQVESRQLTELTCPHVAAVRIYFAMEYIDMIKQAPFRRWGIAEENGE